MRKRLLTWLATAGAASALAAGVARADVLEIAPDGSVLRRAGAGAPVWNDPSRPVQPSDIPNIAAAAVTLVDASAGPARYEAAVRAAADRHQVSPALLEALVWQESRWREGQTSRAGAQGLTQLMPGTARELGVDPNDPAAALEGGARYLRAQLNRFNGDVELALAAYNAGPRRVQRAGGVPAIRETRDYVAAVVGRLAAAARP